MACGKTLPAYAALFFTAASAAAGAQQTAFTIELNDAQDVNGGCRLVYVAMNSTGKPLQKASYDVFTFDAAGKVSQSLVFQFGAFPVNKTKVVQFDLANRECSKISRLLINDMTECMVEGQNSTLCMDALKTTTRTSIAFGL
ncbi:hypothetical protein [Arvimicrobium flavum]|uniref:hypothetical protein n=1 Tax=Arvimicrobium flavum TaxID=3393320 RepID=UPI00237A9680|nr:hypothetical protein [Mesorhizobium shangrilense]